MTNDLDFDRAARTWLEEGPTALSDHVLDSALAAVHATPQRRTWTRRRLPMNRFALQLAAAAAVVVVAGVTAWTFLRPPTPAPAASGLVPSTLRASDPRPTTTEPPFTDTNTYVLKLEPGFSAPGADALPAYLEVVGPSDGSGRRLTIEVTGSLIGPDWSPDRSRIAFLASAARHDTIWTVAADGSDPVQIVACDAPCSALGRPAWSPDGAQLAFAEFDSGADQLRPRAGRIVVLALASGKRSIVADGGPNTLPDNPRWSPDGTQLVYERDALDASGMPTSATLSVVGPDGNGDRPLAGLGRVAGQPDWSPDGASLAFSDGLNILTVPLAGGTPMAVTRLSTTSQQANRGPRWTPDGRIVYVHEPTNGVNQIFSIAPDGTKQAPVFSAGGRIYAGDPDPRP